MNNQRYIQNLCENIRELRHRNNLPMEEMAERLAIPVDSLAMLENGVMPENLQMETLVRIQHEFSISLKDIFLLL